MIKLPKFSSQSLYDSETDFNLQMTRERMSKFLIHHECFKKINEVYDISGTHRRKAGEIE